MAQRPQWNLWKRWTIIGWVQGGGTRKANGAGWVLVWICALGVALLVAPAAGAQDPAPDETALVDQYKETIPTASGPKVSGGGGNGGGTPLPPAVAVELTQAVGKEDADKLKEVATSPEFGAPQVPLHDPNEGGFAPASDPSPASAAVDAFAGESGGSLLPLLLALVFSTGALFGAAVHRRRKRPV
jgi:hypothetical protein